MSGDDGLTAILERFPATPTVLYGDLVLDRYVLGTPKRISREAPVIILRWEGEEDIPGGGANALANLAAMGSPVVPVGIVGDDEAGAALLAALQRRGVDTSAVVTVPGYRTPTKVRILGGGPSSLKHQVARYDIEPDPPGDGPWRAELVRRLEEAAALAAAVAVSDYGYGAVLPEALARLSALPGRPGWITLDSRFRLGELRGVDGATPNLEELESWAGRRLATDSDVAGAAEALRAALDARFVLATRGPMGMTLVESGAQPVHIPIHGSDQVADVTGAGDTVLAALTLALAAGAAPGDAARLANVAGGLVVMKSGTATVTREELAVAVRGSRG